MVARKGQRRRRRHGGRRAKRCTLRTECQEAWRAEPGFGSFFNVDPTQKGQRWCDWDQAQTRKTCRFCVCCLLCVTSESLHCCCQIQKASPGRSHTTSTFIEHPSGYAHFVIAGCGTSRISAGDSASATGETTGWHHCQTARQREGLSSKSSAQASCATPADIQ